MPRKAVGIMQLGMLMLHSIVLARPHHFTSSFSAKIALLCHMIRHCECHMIRHFEYMRPGGRASQRATDLVRRRCWRRTTAPSGALSAAAARAAGRPGT